MAVRALICDLGGVVIRIDPDRIRRSWAARSSLPEAALRGMYPDEVYEAFERDELTEQQYLAHVRGRLHLHGTDEELAADFNRLYLGVDTDVLDLLAEHRDRGVALMALTNTNRLHHRVWSQRFGTELRVFDAIHCSHDLRARKPEPEAFAAVLGAHGLDPGEAVFVDDLPGHVDAALGAGLQGIVFTDADALRSRLRRLTWRRADTR